MAAVPHSLYIFVPLFFLLFCFFSFLFEFYIGVEGKKIVMDHLKTRGRICVTLLYIGVST